MSKLGETGSVKEASERERWRILGSQWFGVWPLFLRTSVASISSARMPSSIKAFYYNVFESITDSAIARLLLFLGTIMHDPIHLKQACRQVCSYLNASFDRGGSERNEREQMRSG